MLEQLDLVHVTNLHIIIIIIVTIIIIHEVIGALKR